MAGFPGRSFATRGAGEPVVIDSSIALSWCFEDEASPETDSLFERVRDEGAIVPGLWHLELSNLLLQAGKRWIGAGDVTMRLGLIAELPISTDQETTIRAWREILTLARAESLTTYDATYLELAVRRGLPLLTRDNELRCARRGWASKFCRKNRQRHKIQNIHFRFD